MGGVPWDSFIIHTAIDAGGTVCQFLYCHTMTAPGEQGATVPPTRQVRTPLACARGLFTLVARPHLAVRCICSACIALDSPSFVHAAISYRNLPNGRVVEPVICDKMHDIVRLMY